MEEQELPSLLEVWGERDPGSFINSTSPKDQTQTSSLGQTELYRDMDECSVIFPAVYVALAKLLRTEIKGPGAVA